MAYVPLCQLREGQYGIIRSITCSKEKKPYKQAILQRFLDLGFCEETPIQCINKGIFHNPHAYKTEAVFWQSEMKTPLLSL